MDSLFEILESRKTADICNAVQKKYLSLEEIKEKLSDILYIGKDAVSKNISKGKIKIHTEDLYLTFTIEDEKWFDEIIQKRLINDLKDRSFPEEIIIPNSIVANSFYEGIQNLSKDFKYMKKQIDISLMSRIIFKDDDLMFYSCLCSFWKKSEEELEKVEKVKIKFSDIYKFINVDITDTFKAKINESKESNIPIEFKDFLQRMIDMNSIIKNSISLGIEPIKCISYETQNGSKKQIDKKSFQSLLSFSLDEDGIILLSKPSLMEASESLSNQFIILDRKHTFNWKNNAVLQSAKFEILKRIETAKSNKNRMNSAITKNWWNDHFTKINYNSNKLAFFFKRLEKEGLISDLEFLNKSETFVKWNYKNNERDIPRDYKHRASSIEERKTEDNKGDNAPNERAEIQKSLSRDDFQIRTSEN